MNLEQIVPPLELCRMIPAGEFEGSALIWMEVEASATMKKTWSLMQGTPYARQRPNQKIPAPTLQEILEDLTKLCVTPEILHAHKNYWTAQGETLDDDGMYKYHHGFSSNPSTAALKLWLEVNKKGVENE